MIKEYEELFYKFHKLERWERNEISRLIEMYTKGTNYNWYISTITSEVLKADEIKINNEIIKKEYIEELKKLQEDEINEYNMIKINYKRNKEKVNKIIDIIDSIKDIEINKVIKEIKYPEDLIKRIKDIVYAMK